MRIQHVLLLMIEYVIHHSPSICCSFSAGGRRRSTGDAFTGTPNSKHRFLINPDDIGVEPGFSNLDDPRAGTVVSSGAETKQQRHKRNKFFFNDFRCGTRRTLLALGIVDFGPIPKKSTNLFAEGEEERDQMTKAPNSSQ